MNNIIEFSTIFHSCVIVRILIHTGKNSDSHSEKIMLKPARQKDFQLELFNNKSFPKNRRYPEIPALTTSIFINRLLKQSEKKLLRFQSGL